jgi:hypothetical protein
MSIAGLVTLLFDMISYRLIRLFVVGTSAAAVSFPPARDTAQAVPQL